MDLVEVYNGNIFQCQMVKNLLENEGIPSVLADEIIGTRSPVWAPGAGVRVRVPENYSTKARQVVALYEKSQGAPRL